MDYIAPLNRQPTPDDPRPAYFDGNRQTGQEGSYPSGKSLENPMREILAVIEAAGIEPTNADLTQLLQAINNMISTALSNYIPPEGGDPLPPPVPVSFLLNPVYPHVTVNGGTMSVASANAQVAVAAGQTFIHRGGVLHNSSDTPSAQRTFSTAASRTYHLRWRYNGGVPVFGLFDLTDPAYNPGGLAETHASFDSGYDDMLIARVVTNAANSPTVTALLNRHSLGRAEIITGVGGVLAGQQGANFRILSSLNWGRSPLSFSLALAKALNSVNSPDTDYTIFAAGLPRTPNTAAHANAPSVPVTRYGLDCIVMLDHSSELHMQFSCGA